MPCHFTWSLGCSSCCALVHRFRHACWLWDRASSQLTVSHTIHTYPSVSTWGEVWLRMIPLEVGRRPARARLPFILTCDSMCQGGRAADLEAGWTSSLSFYVLRKSGLFYVLLFLHFAVGVFIGCRSEVMSWKRWIGQVLKGSSWASCAGHACTKVSWLSTVNRSQTHVTYMWDSRNEAFGTPRPPCSL